MAVSRLPLALDLTGRRAVVVGGGAVALRKVRALLAARAHVVVVAPELCAELAALAGHDSIDWLPRVYAAGDLSEAWLALAATDSAQVNGQVAADAEVLRVWCNVAAPPSAGSCHLMATVQRGGVAVALATDGASPFAAARIRATLEEALPVELGELVTLLGEVRPRVQARLDDPEARRACYEAMWNSRAGELLAAGDQEGARALLLALIDEAAAP